MIVLVEDLDEGVAGSEEPGESGARKVEANFTGGDDSDGLDL